MTTDRAEAPMGIGASDGDPTSAVKINTSRTDG